MGPERRPRELRPHLCRVNGHICHQMPPVGESHAVMPDQSQGPQAAPFPAALQERPRGGRGDACDAHAWREGSHCPPGPDAADRAWPLRRLPRPCRTAHIWNLAASHPHLSPRAQTRTKVSKMSVRPFAAPSQGLAKLALCLPGEGVPARPYHPPPPRQGPYTCQRSGGRYLFADKIFSASYLQGFGLG